MSNKWSLDDTGYDDGYKDGYSQALEDLNNALLNDKYISKFYGVCEKIVEILARLYK